MGRTGISASETGGLRGVMREVRLALGDLLGGKPDPSHELMLQVHTRGMCVAGVYTYEIAETKVSTVEQMARAAEFPFLCTMEPE